MIAYSLAITPTTKDRSAAKATRERILRAALALIGAEGIAAVSNRRIAREAGVSLGSLTYHFPSQSDLLRETLLLYVGEEVERLNQIAAEMRRRRPSYEQLGAEVESLIQESSGRPELIAELELHINASRDPGLQAASRSCFAAYEDVAAAALESLGVKNPRLHAPNVVALLYGMALRRLGSGRRDAAGTAHALTMLVRAARMDATP